MFLVLISGLLFWPTPTNAKHIEQELDFVVAILLVLNAQSTDQYSGCQATQLQQAQNVVVLHVA
jgi:hypothetical protein